MHSSLARGSWQGATNGVKWVIVFVDANRMNGASLVTRSPSEVQNTIQAVIQATDAEIQRQTGISSRTEPRSLNFATAQRLNTDIKIDASIECVFIE